MTKKATHEMLTFAPLKERVVYKRPLVIYHGNCADGFSAAWCFHYKDPIGYDYYAGVYGNTPPDCAGRVVYLADFSYSAEIVAAICDVALQVVLIDHHKTAIDALADLVNMNSPLYRENFDWHISLDKSGATLAWDYLFNNKGTIPAGAPYYTEPPRLLGHVEDRDLWKFKLPMTREISAALFSYEYTFANWDKLMLGGVTEILDLTASGAAIERKHFKDIAELVKITKRLMSIGEYLVPGASLPYTFSSDAGHLMAKEYLEGAIFAACYWDTDTHRVFSLRSVPGGIDVSEIAKGYGGGGHFHAAGFKVARSHPLAMA